MIRDKTLDRDLDRLVPTYTCDTVSGRSFYIEPDGARIAEETAQKLLEDPCGRT